MNYKELEHYLIKRAVIILLFISFIILCIQQINNIVLFPVIFGWMLGSIVQIFSFKLLCRSVKKSVNFNPKHAYAYTYLQYMFRILIYGITLILGFKMLKLNIIAIGAGLLIIRITIFVETIIGFFKTNKKYSTKIKEVK